MSGYVMPHECHPLMGTEWRINDSGTRFRVVDIEHRYAVVENVNGAPRRVAS